MTAAEEYRCADCGAILAHPGEKHTHEDCCRHWQHRAAKATEYARIEVKRKNEAVERECEAIERAEKAEAALIYDSYGDMVQTWKSRAAALEAARDSERTLRKQAEAELHELTRELEKERETARLRLHFQQRAEAENERLRDALAEIVEWVQLNHRHHEDGDDQECQCWHSDSPYVDSLDLVAFVMTKRMGK